MQCICMSTTFIPNKLWSYILPLLRKCTMLYRYGCDHSQRHNPQEHSGIAYNFLTDLARCICSWQECTWCNMMMQLQEYLAHRLYTSTIIKHITYLLMIDKLLPHCHIPPNNKTYYHLPSDDRQMRFNSYGNTYITLKDKWIHN
jgi:hypothetical protein